MTHTQTQTLSFSIVLAMVVGLVPVPAFADGNAPREQEFVITAYYSPKPDQCCYIRGSYGADVVLNGQGTNGADGTEVFPGMAAAPKSYAFGTIIELPGLGVVRVNDRGGAINELGNGSHRLDLWVGEGEEGLARALTFGVRRVRGTIYPVGSAAPKISMDFSTLSAPLETLRAFQSEDPFLLSLEAEKGQHSLSIKLLQESLKKAGYFTVEPNGTYGPDTQKSIQALQADFGIQESSEKLMPRTAAFLAALSLRPDKNPAWISEAALDPKNIPSLKRGLRSLGFYKGRTTNENDDRLRASIIAFQVHHGIVSGASDQYAGSVGPKTRAALKKEWLKNIIALQAEKILFAQKIHTLVAERGVLVESFLEQGSKGDQVTRLQKFLASKGYIAAHRVTGTFGAETETALIAYQIDAKIVATAKSKGAGFAGPATLAQIRKDIEKKTTLLVRAEGWDAL